MTELREFAETVLRQPTLAVKVATPDLPFTDESPGRATVVERPEREPSLKPAAHGRAVRMPRFGEFGDRRARGVAHNLMASHELQALEIMAATLLRSPDAPREFRFGLAEIMLDEQRHTRMHAARARQHGVPVGSIGLNEHIWNRAREFRDLLDYLAGVPLLFEGANLDHSIEFAEAFEAVGDQRSAHVMRQIHDDEIEHVAFGLTWLRRMKPAGVSDWDAFVDHLRQPLEPRRARGRRFQRAARVAAGLDQQFIDNLEAAVGTSTSRTPLAVSGRSDPRDNDVSEADAGEVRSA